ncbi:MAG: ROK family protein [Phaeodactylibacter sp.]|nr:ROK family protein [Phaeodactylibacter sp.]
MQPLWGIDLGGTKIEGVILNGPESADVIARLRIPTEAEKGYEHIVAQAGRLVGLLRSASGLEPARIGLGGPGVPDPDTQLMKNCNTTVLNGRPLLKDLETALRVPVALANDANCFVVAETRLGVVREQAPEAGTVFGVIMGTGVGGGVTVGGKLLAGRHGIAGEWGHNFLDESGGACYCGRSGCVETVISGPALERYYARRSGQERKLPQIVERHKAGHDPAATATVERLIHFFGKGIAAVINILDPDVVVLGGGLGNIGLLYSEGVAAARQFVFNDSLRTKFLRPKLGDSAGVFGAALLVENV